MRAKYPYYQVEPIADLKDLLEKSYQRFSKRTALQWKDKDHAKYRSMSYHDLYQNIESLATALEQLGLQPGDKVAILSENRPEWATTYLAVAGSGAACLPIDKDLRSQEIFHILYFCEAKFIVASEKYIDDLLSMQSRLPSLQLIISMDEAPKKTDKVDRFANLVDQGRRAVKKGDKTFRQRTVHPDDLAAIIFSSGTMGNPKGVMLSHKNIATNVMQTTKSVYVDQKDRFLSVLPLHHTYECTAGFLVAIYRGSTIAYAENLRRIVENMAETKTTVMLGVPLLYEAIFNRMQAAIQQKGEFKFKLGKGLARASEKLLRVNLRRRIFAQVHKRLGGHLRLFICGGAPLRSEIPRGFRELGINFLQGYGLTEAAPLVAVNRDKAFKDEAVGLPMDQVEYKIVEGELWVKGDNVMQGYYRNPDAIDEALQDGWLRTGDLGYFDDDGFLHIQGRQKAVIVTPNGKNVSPEEVELELLKSPYILECLVWGGPDPKEAEVQAIILPNIEQLDVDFGGKGEVLTRERIEAILREEVNKYGAGLAAYKRVKKFTLREEEFAKTTTRKIKRYLYTSADKPISARGEA
jgi:long-chain acyl-CoA synthetase